MKKLLFMIVISSMFCSCESNGPKSRYYAEPQHSADEVIRDVNDAKNTDGWLYEYDTDVFYMEDGEWICYGRVSVYKNLEDERDRKWVEFDGMKFAAEDADRGGYSYKVQYGGVWFYF